jgi:hypothetical protein
VWLHLQQFSYYFTMFAEQPQVSITTLCNGNMHSEIFRSSNTVSLNNAFEGTSYTILRENGDSRLF